MRGGGRSYIRTPDLGGRGGSHTTIDKYVHVCAVPGTRYIRIVTVILLVDPDLP
jgi:hypothetical protein